MRRGTYAVFEILAWPAAVWCSGECVWRIASGNVAGLGEPALVAAAAVGTIVACLCRMAALALRPGPERL